MQQDTEPWVSFMVGNTVRAERRSAIRRVVFYRKTRVLKLWITDPDGKPKEYLLTETDMRALNATVQREAEANGESATDARVVDEFNGQIRIGHIFALIQNPEH